MGTITQTKPKGFFNLLKRVKQNTISEIKKQLNLEYQKLLSNYKFFSAKVNTGELSFDIFIAKSLNAYSVVTYQPEETSQFQLNHMINVNSNLLTLFTFRQDLVKKYFSKGKFDFDDYTLMISEFNQTKLNSFSDEVSSEKTNITAVNDFQILPKEEFNICIEKAKSYMNTNDQRHLATRIGGFLFKTKQIKVKTRKLEDKITEWNKLINPAVVGDAGYLSNPICYRGEIPDTINILKEMKEIFVIENCQTMANTIETYIKKLEQKEIKKQEKERFKKEKKIQYQHCYNK